MEGKYRLEGREKHTVFTLVATRWSGGCYDRLGLLSVWWLTGDKIPNLELKLFL